MLDEMLKQVRAAEDEARKIAARGDKEAERLLGKIDTIRETETEKALEEVRQVLDHIEKIRIEKANATAEQIREEGQREILEIRERAKPRLEEVAREIRDIIEQG